VFGILYDLIDKICRLPQFTASLFLLIMLRTFLLIMLKQK